MDQSINDRHKLSIQRIAGGSIIDKPPLFSEDGEHLFVVRSNTVCVYSTNTGEWIRDLDEEVNPTGATIVNIQNMPNPKMLVGCTVHGDIRTWNHRTGTIEKVVRMNFPEKSVEVATFNVIPFDENKNCGLITWTCESGRYAQMGIFDLEEGRQIQSKLLALHDGEHKVAVTWNIIAVIQNFKLHVVNYRNGRRKWHNNAQKVNFTSVACHLERDLVAVGDEKGRIFIYYDFFEAEQPINTLYHWHHNPVTTLSFTTSGSRFYSGGYERCLVGWYDYEKTSDSKHVLPRLQGGIVHVVLSSDNQKIAVATDDNGIMLLDPQNELISDIQNLVRVANDKTPWSNFPIGLKVDPRTSSIVMNGRIGQLQFYSPHNRSVFNFDATMDNRLSLELERILYNTRITHAAFNVDWLVTAESLDDLEHLAESRLKFWKYDAQKSTYALNTQCESPHVGGVTALQFSSSFDAENLLCASTGLDRKLKMWSLEKSDVIDSKSPLDEINGEADKTSNATRHYWICIESTSFKDLSVTSLAFSTDGSLLSVGFGNTLCLYTPATLRIIRVLNTPYGADGSTNKVIVNVPQTSSASKMSQKEQKHRIQLTERRRRILQMAKAYLENDDDKLLAEVMKKTENDRTNALPLRQLRTEDQEFIFKEIMAQNSLNFYQKIELLQKIGINIGLPADLKEKCRLYIRDNMQLSRKENDLTERSRKLGPNAQFIGQHKLQNFLARRSDAMANGLAIKNVTFDNEGKMSHKNDQPMETEKNSVGNPIRKVAQINHVLFGTGSCSHFVMVCTEKRLLIWNLLSYCLHAAHKLSVKHIAVDPCTSLVAAFTVFDELYVFLPSKPYVLYQRSNMPKIEGAVWLPRLHPKAQSLDVNWQSISQLYFLSKDQELLSLFADNDEEILESKAISLKIVPHLEPRTHFGAMIAKQITNATVSLSGPRNIAGGLVGETTKICVESLADQQTHTMAPVRLLCYDFLKTLISNRANQTVNQSSTQINTHQSNESGDSDSDESMEANPRAAEREATPRPGRRLSVNDHEMANNSLKKLYSRQINFNLEF